MSSIHRAIGLTAVLFLLGAVYGCEKTYGTSDAEMLRQQFDLTDELMSLPCLDTEFRSNLQKSKELEHYHPRLVRERIESLTEYIAIYRRREASGATCEELIVR